MALVKTFPVSELIESQGKQITINDKPLAIFKIENSFYAIDNTCPHRGAPLADGELAGTVLTCPWHRWEFDVTTGKSPVNPAACVKTYPCQVSDSDLMVDIS